MCCLIFTKKGLAYFGVLIQLLVALLIIPLITLFIAFTLGTSKDGSGRFLSSSQISFVSLYCLGLCVLGLIIFKGIREESLTSLYISIVSLLLVQLVAGVVTILSWNSSSSGSKELAIRVTCLVLNVLSSVVYIVILLSYSCHLRKKLEEEYAEEEQDFYQKI